MILMIKTEEVEVEVDAAGAACDSYFLQQNYYMDNNQELVDRIRIHNGKLIKMHWQSIVLSVMGIGGSSE